MNLHEKIDIILKVNKTSYFGVFLLISSMLVGCEGQPLSAQWWFEFESLSLQVRTSVIEATIVEGGCNGDTTVYENRFFVGSTPTAPPVLDPGTYGFAGKAYDVDCYGIAYGCVDLTLPAAGVTVRLEEADLGQDPSCSDPHPDADVDSDSDAGVDTDPDGDPDADPDVDPGFPFVLSNVDESHLVDEGTVEIHENDTFNTDTCEDLPGSPVVVSQTSGSEICVQRGREFALDKGVVLRVVGSRPLVWLAMQTVTINGVLDMSATGTTPGSGGSAGADFSSQAEGSNPGENGGHVGTYDDGGGGGGGACGAGGFGGTGDDGDGGDGGGAYGSSYQLVPLRGGSGGGLGGGGESAGFGGAGGGAFQISAGVAITVGGSILAGGGGGIGAGDGTSDDYNVGAGGGGGSGGAVLLESPQVSIAPGANILATGGGGGGAGSCREAGFAEDGQDGRDALVAQGGERGDPCSSGFTVGSDGGRSGGGTTVDGEDGGDYFSEDGDGGNGGGGGGGAGCIFIRNETGTLPSEGVLSPSVGPGLRATPLKMR